MTDDEIREAARRVNERSGATGPISPKVVERFAATLERIAKRTLFEDERVVAIQETEHGTFALFGLWLPSVLWETEDGESPRPEAGGSHQCADRHVAASRGTGTCD